MSLILRKRIAMLTPAAPAGFSVVYFLTNVVSSNTDNTVAIGGAYNTTLTPATNHNISSVIVTMGGIDITSTAYSNGVIAIAEVTGAVVITAAATHIYAGWVRMRVKRGDSSNTVGWITRSSTIMSSNVSKMMVDGVEVTKNFKYDFGDDDLHTVYLLLTSSTDLPGSIFWCQAGCIRYLWIPSTYVVLGASSIRGLGSSSSSTAADLLWTNPNTPTSIGGNNNTANTYVRVYVPDASVQDYQTISGNWPKTQTRAMSTYTGIIY